MKRFLAPVLWIAGLAYPFVVALSLDRLSAAWLALPLAALWLWRAVSSPLAPEGASRLARLTPRLAPLFMLAFCLALALVDAVAAAHAKLWLRAYPVLVNAMLLTVFGLSLNTGTPVIEQIARLRHPDLPPQAVAYTRKLTRVWCLFFAGNGLIAAALALWGSWSWWMLYNGAISYALAGALMLGEWLLRPADDKQASPQP